MVERLSIKELVMSHDKIHSVTSRIVQMNRMWAKTNQDASSHLFHPLSCHMLDVAAVASVVWDHHFTANLKDRLECALALTDARSLLIFLAGAHDIGKATPGFQKKAPDLSDCLGLPFSKNDQDRPHGIVSAFVLNYEILGTCSASALLGQIVGGHHGVFPRSCDLQLGRDTLGNDNWKTIRKDLVEQFASVIGFDLDLASRFNGEIMDPFIIPFMAGFISVVDWIASNQEFFPCVADCLTAPEIESPKYWQEALINAKHALDTLGWSPPVTFAEEAAFREVFPDLQEANTLQSTANQLAFKQSAPYLMIIEAPMGSGKTEAAIYATDLAMCRGFARGMYIAMPTQATGNAMFKRVLEDYLRDRGHQGKLNMQLVHGDALLAASSQKIYEGEILTFKPQSIDEGADIEAQSWFTARKRPLLAPFGVGTIDQSLLSVLQTKHWFVRLFGLAGKVVVFDEIHAYDAYMNTILERLLHWLAELDCTVILLSATLPEAKRKTLTKAYSGRDDAQYVRYPRITLATPRHFPHARADDQPTCVEIPIRASRTVDLEFGGTDVGTLAKALSRRLETGGCAAVICNTVNRSIEVYRRLRDTLEGTDCLLFHARTLQMWRREREAEVLRKFGKGVKHRPTRAVLVATQVIEQSLDLDFDLIVSEIAPIDLLLQRMGRLHRHARQRPPGLESPHFILLCDADRVGPPPESFSKSNEHVYERYVLLRTWLALRGRDNIDVPAEIESLVEMVYGESIQDGEDGWHEALGAARERMETSQTESQKAARRLLIKEPRDPSDLIEQFSDQLVDDDDPKVHRSIRAATREGDPSIAVVMLPLNKALTHDPEIPEVRCMLDRSVKVNHRGLFTILFKNGESPSEWTRNAHLRHVRLVRLNDRNQGRVGNYLLTVDKDLGVVIETEEG